MRQRAALILKAGRCYKLSHTSDIEYYVHRIGRTGRAGKKEGLYVYLWQRKEQNFEMNNTPTFRYAAKKSPLLTNRGFKNRKSAE